MPSTVTPELCKKCVFYVPLEKTCRASGVAVVKGRVFHDYAKAVRLDPKRCGPDAKLFREKDADADVEDTSRFFYAS